MKENVSQKHTYVIHFRHVGYKEIIPEKMLFLNNFEKLDCGNTNKNIILTISKNVIVFYFNLQLH